MPKPEFMLFIEMVLAEIGSMSSQEQFKTLTPFSLQGILSNARKRMQAEGQWWRADEVAQIHEKGYRKTLEGQ